MTNTETLPTPTLEAVQPVIDRYIEAWNTTDDARRLELLETVFTDEAKFIDPFVEADGAQGVADFIGGMQAQFADHVLARTTVVDLHHDLARFGWVGTAPDGTVAFGGIDVVVLAEDGRFTAVAGFLGDLAPV